MGEVGKGMSINRVTISGNLTRDAEFRALAGGTCTLAFSVAVSDRRQSRETGEWEDVPNYVDCVVFGKRAQALDNRLPKGTKVAIEGKLRWSQWQDRETGRNRSKLEVIVGELEFMSRQGQSQAPQPAQAPLPMAQDDTYDEDIPF